MGIALAFVGAADHPWVMEIERPDRPISLAGAAGMLASALVIVGLVLVLEGALPWESQAVSPTATPQTQVLALSATGQPPILAQDTPLPKSTATTPLVTAPPGPADALHGVIVGGVTDPPRPPKPAPTATPSPSPTPAGPFGGPPGPPRNPWPRPTSGHPCFRWCH